MARSKLQDNKLVTRNFQLRNHNFIAHRGLLNGPDSVLENHPEQLLKAAAMGYGIECDLRYITGTWWLGHDYGKYQIDMEFFKAVAFGKEGDDIKHSPRIWIHCKTLETLQEMHRMRNLFRINPSTFEMSKSGLFWHNLNWFYHETDNATITSNGIVWTHPKAHFVPKNSAWVVPNESPDFNDDRWSYPFWYCTSHLLLLQGKMKDCAWSNYLYQQ